MMQISCIRQKCTPKKIKVKNQFRSCDVRKTWRKCG